MKHDTMGQIGRRSLLSGASAVALASGAGLLTGGWPRRARAADKSVRVLSVEDPFFFALKEFTEDFHQETGITVELESLSYDALQARLVSSFVGHTSDADVICVDQMWSGQYLDNGWIVPLNDYIKADKSVHIKDFVPEVLHSLNTWRGKFATLPVASYAQGVIYRKDVFDSFGIAHPPVATDEAWTWDKYLETLNGLAGKEFGGAKLFPTVICGAQPVPIVHMFTQLTASNGATWFKSFPRAPWDFAPETDSAAWTAAVELYQKLYKLSPPEAINYVWFDAGTRFAQGDIGMFYWWTPYFYLVKNAGYMTGKASSVMDKYAVAALPKAPGVPQTVSVGGWSFGIPASSEKRDDAWQFVKWATSAATQKKMALYPKLNYQFSDFGRRSLYNDPEIAKIYPYLDVQLAMMQQGNGKIARPPVPTYSSLESIMGLELNKIISGGTSAKDALAEMKMLFTNVLKGNFMIPYKLPAFDDTLDATKALIQSLA
jgi:multiple sugar transport system substrate-binding protein